MWFHVTSRHDRIWNRCIFAQLVQSCHLKCLHWALQRDIWSISSQIWPEAAWSDMLSWLTDLDPLKLTASSHLKMDGWNTNTPFLLGWESRFFQGRLLLVSGRVVHVIHVIDICFFCTSKLPFPISLACQGSHGTVRRLHVHVHC